MTASTTPHTPTRPPCDPQLGALLADSPLPAAVTAETIEHLRTAPFTAPVEEVLSTRPPDHEVGIAPDRPDRPDRRAARHRHRPRAHRSRPGHRSVRAAPAAALSRAAAAARSAWVRRTLTA
jgi:hypothetical protein